MKHWLLKTEAEVYSYADLTADKRTVWDGVNNALALKHIREIEKGDLVFVYHTGDEKAVAGIAEVMKSSYADPKLDDPKRAVVDLVPKQALKHPVTLKRIKADKAFAEWALVKNSRLSAMPVPVALWDRILKLSETADE